MSTQRRRDDRGATLIVFALALVALLGIAALAVDLGYARQLARHGQASVDAGALAGASLLPPVGTAGLARQRAAEYTWSNLVGAGGPALPAASACGPGVPGSPTVHSTCYTDGEHLVVVTAPVQSRTDLIEALACRPSVAFFAQVSGNEAPTVCRRAVAELASLAPGTGLGLLVLKEEETPGQPADCTGDLRGGGSADPNIRVTRGATIVNSAHQTALCGSGGPWSIEADLIGIVGGHQGNVGPSGNLRGPVRTGIMPAQDPLAELPGTPCEAPAVVLCDPVTGRPLTLGVCAASMRPGRFTSKCTRNGNTDMLPGVYWFDNGFDIRNNAITCTTCTANAGVLMYFHGGTLEGNGNPTMNLRPFTQAQVDQAGVGGTVARLYAGVSIYQRRGNTASLDFYGTPEVGSIGTIYAPDAHLELRGTPRKNVTGSVIVSTFTVRGTGAIRITVPSDGIRLPSEPQIRLFQ